MATGFWYGKAPANILGGEAGGDTFAVDFLTDTIKVALAHTDTPVQDTDETLADVTEITGTGYTAGGVTLATKTVTYTAGTNKTVLDADDVSWTTASFTASYAVIYKSTGTGSTSPLLGYVDFGGAQTVTAGTFSIQWDATNGLLYFTVS